MAIWISRYSNKELQSGKYYPVGISIGTPKFPLGYTLRKQCYSLAPKGYMLNMELDRFKPAYYEKLEGIGTDRIIDMVEKMNTEARAEGKELVSFWQAEIETLKFTRKVSKKSNLKVIEDAAQAHGAIYKGKNVGALGDAGCFSFYPTKNMTTSEGGIITTDDEELAKRARIFRAHGSSIKYTHDEIGYNFRMTDISAAIGLAQLNVIDGFNDKRIANAEYLNEGLKDVDGVVTPYSADDFKHVYHQYTILVEKGKRDDWVDFLTQKGIGTGVHYPIPLYNQPIYKKLGIEGSAPDAELAANHVISLPVHPSLTQEDLDLVIDAVKQASDSFN